MLTTDMATTELKQLQTALECSVFRDECYSTGDLLDLLAISQELERREQAEDEE